MNFYRSKKEKNQQNHHLIDCFGLSLFVTSMKLVESVCCHYLSVSSPKQVARRGWGN